MEEGELKRGLIYPVIRNKCHRHSTEGEETTEASSCHLPEESGICTVKDLKDFEAFFPSSAFPTFVIFISCFCMVLQESSI